MSYYVRAKLAVLGFLLLQACAGIRARVPGISTDTVFLLLVINEENAEELSEEFYDRWKRLARWSERYPEFRFMVRLRPVLLKKLSETEKGKELLQAWNKLQDSGQFLFVPTPYSDPLMPLLYREFPMRGNNQIYQGISIYRTCFGTIPRGLFFLGGEDIPELRKRCVDIGLRWYMWREYDRNSSQLYLMNSSGQGIYIGRRESQGETMDFLSPTLPSFNALISSDLPRLMAVEFRADSQVTQTLEQFCKKITAQQRFRVVFPEEYLACFPVRKPMPPREKNREEYLKYESQKQAWKCLKDAHYEIERYKNSGQARMNKLSRALEALALAQKGEYFWWLGPGSFASGAKEEERKFRENIINVYENIGRKVPSRLFLPLGGAPSTGEGIRGYAPLIIDGQILPGEREKASWMEFTEGPAEGLIYSVDERNLYLGVTLRNGFPEKETVFIGFYFGFPGYSRTNILTRNRAKVGMSLTHEIGFWSDKPEGVLLSQAIGHDRWEGVVSLATVKKGKKSLEMKIPFKYFNILSSGDSYFRVVVETDEESFLYPLGEPATLLLPKGVRDESTLEIVDPWGDDHGPGFYTYPALGDFSKGDLDIKEFSVRKEGEKVLFMIKLGRIINPWSGPLGFSFPLIDIYIDINHRVGTGNVSLLPGRKSYTLPEDAWEYVLTLNGWNREIYRMGREDEPVKMASTFDVAVDEQNAVLTLSVPGAVLRGNPENWGYTVVCMGYDPQASEKVREVYVQEKDKRYFGGGLEDGSSPPIIDLLTPPGVSQKEILSAYLKKRVVEIPAVRFRFP